MSSRKYCLAIGIVLFFYVGCGSSGAPTYDVSGKVMMGGKPVESGTIRFAPGPGQPATDPAVAAIKMGDYTAKVTAGTKRVEIEAYTATGPEFDGKPTNLQVVPPEFNLQSTLTADIKAGTNKDVNFTITIVE